MFDMGSFSSLFQLSAAVHLGGGALYSLTDFLLKPYRRHRDFIVENISRIQRHRVDSEPLENAVAALGLALVNAENDLRPAVLVATIGSFLFAAYSLGWLVACAFAADHVVSGSVITISLAVAVLPMPAMLLAVWLRFRQHRVSLNLGRKNVTAVFHTALDAVATVRQAKKD